MLTRCNCSLALLLAAMASCSAVVAAETDDGAVESRWRLGAALGYGQRANPLVLSDDVPIYVDLDIAWFGDHWFFDNGDLGLTFANNDRLTASFVARFNSDRVFFGLTDKRFVAFDSAGAPLAEATEFEVPDRDYAIELGMELLTDGDWGQLQASAYHDVSGTHDGYEIHASYSYGWRNQRLYFEPSVGASYKSAALNDYYWGVSPDEADIVVLPYEADAGTNLHARLMFGYQINRNWSFSLVTEYERINDEAASSPIVEDRDVLGYFAGFSYRFR